MVDLPYCSVLGNIQKYFERIKQAKTPDDRFSPNFLKNTLNFKSNNDNRIIGLLKAMKFIDESSRPLQLYRDFRSETVLPSVVIGKGLKNAYSSLYARDEEIHKKSDEDVKGHVIAVTGSDENAPTVRLITQTFVILSKISKFEEEQQSILSEKEKQNLPVTVSDIGKKFNLTHTIVINLPTTTTQEVYDAIFKSLKENLS